MKKLLLFACIAPLTLALACDLEEDGSDDAVFAEDPFGDEVTPRCAFNGVFHVSAPLVGDGQSPSFTASMSASSPSATYASGSCVDYFVIQATGALDGRPYLLVHPEWKDFTLTQSQCPWTVVYYDISIYYGGAWHQRVASSSVGVWDGSACKIGGRVQVYDPNHQAEKVQVAVKAKFLDGSGEHYAKVGATVVKSSILIN